MSRLYLLPVIAFLLAGCAIRYDNLPLQRGAENEERRTIDVSHKDRPVILVAVSGGGARAAAFGWAVLNELKKSTYVFEGKQRRLIDDVAIISSVSGGSVIAAYYGLYGADRLDQFEQDFLVADNEGPLISQILNPFAAISRLAEGTSRSEPVKQMLDEKLFHEATLADLNQPGKPLVIMNATDMGSGEVFSLTPRRFNDICSDHDRLPLATGVTASAAVPVVFSPIAFENFSESHCAGRPLPPWIEKRLSDPYAPYLNLESYKRARYANDLRRGPMRYRDIRYIYLVDGGLADNLGVHGLLDAASNSHDEGSILWRVNQGHIKKLVVIVINAHVDEPNSAYTSSMRPGLGTALKSVFSVPIASASANVNTHMEDLLEEIRKAARSASPNSKLNGMKVYSIQVGLDQLRLKDGHQSALRAKTEKIPTSWNISPENRETVKEVAKLLVRQHPCFQRLLLDVRADAPFADREFAAKGCPM